MAVEKVKCPGCHAYFVNLGEVCSNCRGDEEADKEENEEENEEGKI